MLLVTLDVSNVFDSVRWVNMIDKLENNFHVQMFLLRIFRVWMLQDQNRLGSRRGQHRGLAIVC